MEALAQTVPAAPASLRRVDLRHGTRVFLLIGVQVAHAAPALCEERATFRLRPAIGRHTVTFRPARKGAF